MRALITGVLGFTGKHLARRLAAEPGVSVIGVDLPANPPQDLPLTEYISGDVAAEGTMAVVIKERQPDLVFHLSGSFSGSVPTLYRANLMAALEVLEAVRSHAPAAKVLLAGSAAEYGPVNGGRLPITESTPCVPVTPYGRAKYAATQAALDYARRGVAVVVVRPFNIIGPGVPPSLVVGAIVERLRDALQRGDDEVRVGNLDCERDFIAVDDIVNAYMRLMQQAHWGQVFNLCSGRPTAIRSVVETLLSYAPRPMRVVVDPALVRADDVPVSYGTWERAHQAFGFVPVTSLDDALRAAWIGRLGAQPQ